MKKIIILLISFIYSIPIYANFDIKSCQNEYFNNCPSYSIGKVLDDTKVKKILDYNKLENGKIEKGLKYEKILFPVGDNYVFLFSGGIEKYNEVVLNSRDLHNEKLPYYLKKDDIVIYSSPNYLKKEDIKDKYFLDFKSNDSYVEDGNNVMGIDEYEYIIDGYNGDFIYNDEFGGFEKIYCENDIINIYDIENKPESLAITFDSITKPKINLGYNLKDLEKDLQALAPCSKFNELFGLKEEIKLNDNEKNMITESKLNEIEKSWFEKIIYFIKSIFSKFF